MAQLFNLHVFWQKATPPPNSPGSVCISMTGSRILFWKTTSNSKYSPKPQFPVFFGWGKIKCKIDLPAVYRWFTSTMQMESKAPHGFLCVPAFNISARKHCSSVLTRTLNRMIGSSSCQTRFPISVMSFRVTLAGALVWMNSSTQ